MNGQTCVPPPPGLVSWWRAEGDASDEVGGNSGTAVGNVTYAAGKVGQAFGFDGAGSYVNIASTDSINFSNNMPMSIETWVYRTGSASIMHVVGKRAGCTYGGAQYQMAFDPSHGLNFYSEGVLVSTYQQLPLNAWEHLAVTYDGTTAIFYINGQAAGSGTGTLGPTTTAALKIGGSGDCATFAGLIDEVAIYNRALSAWEVQSIYSAGSAGKCVSRLLNPVITTDSFVVRLLGVPFLSYTVEAASSVSGPWTKVGNLTVPGVDQGLGLGVIQFSEPRQPDLGRFYRTVYPAY